MPRSFGRAAAMVCLFSRLRAVTAWVDAGDSLSGDPRPDMPMWQPVARSKSIEDQRRDDDAVNAIGVSTGPSSSCASLARCGQQGADRHVVVNISDSMAV